MLQMQTQEEDEMTCTQVETVQPIDTSCDDETIIDDDKTVIYSNDDESDDDKTVINDSNDIVGDKREREDGCECTDDDDCEKFEFDVKRQKMSVHAKIIDNNTVNEKMNNTIKAVINDNEVIEISDEEANELLSFDPFKAPKVVEPINLTNNMFGEKSIQSVECVEKCILPNIPRDDCDCEETKVDE